MLALFKDLCEFFWKTGVFFIRGNSLSKKYIFFVFELSCNYL